LDEGDEEERVEMVVSESYESKENPELELDERELHREWLEMIDKGEEHRAGNWSRTGVIHVGASAIMAKSLSSSSSSSSNNC
jgi:hypothetical protein